jgi:hypothetical protein
MAKHDCDFRRWRIAILPPDDPSPRLGEMVILIHDHDSFVDGDMTEVSESRVFAYVKKGKRWVTLATYYK